MNPELYHPVFLYSVSLLTVVIAYRYLSSPDYSLQEQQGPHIIWVIAISLIYAFWLGGRPMHTAFGDTGAYVNAYNLLEPSYIDFDWTQEWLFSWIGVTCKKLNLEPSDYLFVVYMGYIFSALWAVKRLMPNNPMLGMLFVWGALSYYTFGINGIRNGLACHILLLAYSYLLDGKLTIGALLCMFAFGIHRSTMLPIASFFAAMYVVREPKNAIIFWLSSIVISLLAGDVLMNFFASLGFDDRMDEYASSENLSEFSSTGFRWDFLLYSSMPILLGWYVTIERKIIDNWYNVLLVTYCLANAFWVLVIEVQFSNRFAYLSWFLYPIVIAYPLINMPIWEEQDKITGQILLAYIGFTMFMNIVYWG